MMGSDGTNKSTSKVSLFTCFKAEPKKTVGCICKLAVIVIDSIYSVGRYIISTSSKLSWTGLCIIFTLCVLLSTIVFAWELNKYKKLKQSIQKYENIQFCKSQLKSISIYWDLFGTISLLIVVVWALNAKFTNN